jgi:putative oxidoreductase
MNTSPHVQSPFMNAPRAEGSNPAWFWPVLSIAVGAVFIYAGVLKAWNPIRFTDDIQNYRILSYPFAVRLAFYLPWLEILCGAALIAGRLRSGATAILSALMLVFVGATIAAKARGINIDCGCFGGASKGMTFAQHMLIDLAILGALGALWFRPAPRLPEA